MMDVRESASPPPKKQKIEETDNSELQQQGNEMDFTEDNLSVEDNFTIGDKYTDIVNPADVEKLREFRVLDEVKDNEGDSNDEDSDSSEGKSEDLPDEELEKMLDEDLPPELKEARKPKEKPYVTRTKIVLEEKGVNQFEILPLDWMMVRHSSGMPVYMHRPSRVCTLSKPYFIGKGNTRRHDIPISAIPCLAYRRALTEEEKQRDIDRRVEEQIRDKKWLEAQGLTVLNRDDNMPTNSEKTDNLPKIAAFNVKSTKIAESQPMGKCPFSSINLKKQAGEGKSDEENQGEEDEKKIGIRNDDKGSEDNKANMSPKLEIVESNTNEIISQCVKEQSNDGLKSNTEVLVTTNGTKVNDGDTNDNNATDNTNDKNANVPKMLLEDIPLNRQPVILPGGIIMPSPIVESVNNNWKTQQLTPEQINDYCKALFKFKVVNFMHFNRWADRRKYTKARKALQYPKLPEGTKLITIPATTTGQDGKLVQRDWVMNMDGSSYLSEFHKYVCRALNKRPVYDYKQLENASTPYQATVYIGDMQYGVGLGSSKRQAKYAAVRASLQVLIPEMKDAPAPPAAPAAPPAAAPDTDFDFFDYVGIEDPRIAEFCAATCEPSPHAILLTCLLRNFGAGDWQPKCEMKKLEYQKIELTMRVGQHTATVVCKNKKTAKQRASQAILQALHPHVKSWGSLLRLYGSRSVKSCKEKKLEEQQITLLQDKARHNEPNHAVLDKLRAEMRKLQARDAAVVPIGTLLLADALPSHSASSLGAVRL